MDFAHLDSPRTEHVFSPTDSHYHLPPSFPMNSPPEYHGVDGGYFGPSYGPHSSRQGSRSMSVANTEEGDTANRSRLTQEQLAHLEREFAQRYKPNTDYKRALAESMGVEYQKVNNWFQNRRAKAKHQNLQEPRFDLSTDEEAGEFPIKNMSSQPGSLHQQPSSTQFSSPQQGSFIPTDFPANLDFHSLNNAQEGYSVHANALPNNGLSDNISGTSAYESNGALQPHFSNIIGTDPMWSAHDFYGMSAPKIPTPVILEQDPFGWSPVSSTDHPSQLSGVDFVQGSIKPHGQPMYHSTINGDLVGNPSSQTFVTASSEDGDHPKLITPPQETSPMLELNQGDFPHRESIPSELAEDFDTIHLQNPHGLGLYTTSNSTAAPPSASSSGLATPDVSPDTATIRPTPANGHDLASRRRRPRPPTLQPQSGRSASYAGPMTMSPHLRVSSPSAGKISPVRRIKSTGNNLNIINGRVAKPGSTSAQMSPRNFESCFQVVKTEPKPTSGLSTVGVQTPSANAHIVNSSSPATMAPKSLPPWPDFPSQYCAMDPSSDQIAHDNIPVHYAASFSLPPSPPNHSNTASPPSQYEQLAYPQQFSVPYPIQSAPAHQTTFFHASPPMVPGNFTPAGWPTPSITPPEPYRDAPTMPTPLRPSNSLHHSHSTQFNYFQAPQSSFHGYSSGVGGFQHHQHPLKNVPTSAKKELDIKIEKGPPPPRELSQYFQENKTYTFNHSTPEDFSPAGNAKK